MSGCHDHCAAGTDIFATGNRWSSPWRIRSVQFISRSWMRTFTTRPSRPQGDIWSCLANLGFTPGVTSRCRIRLRLFASFSSRSTPLPPCADDLSVPPGTGMPAHHAAHTGQPFTTKVLVEREKLALFPTIAARPNRRMCADSTCKDRVPTAPGVATTT